MYSACTGFFLPSTFGIYGVCRAQHLEPGVGASGRLHPLAAWGLAGPQGSAKLEGGIRKDTRNAWFFTICFRHNAWFFAVCVCVCVCVCV